MCLRVSQKVYFLAEQVVRIDRVYYNLEDEEREHSDLENGAIYEKL